MKKILLIISMVTLLLLTACGSGVVATGRLETDVLILDTYHHDSWVQPIHIGKTWTYIPHPETNRVIVSYEGGEFEIDDEATYDKYYDSIGETVTGVFKITAYDNGTRRYELIGLED